MDYQLDVTNRFDKFKSDPSSIVNKMEDRLKKLPNKIHDVLLNQYDFIGNIKRLEAAGLLLEIVSHISKIDLDPDKISDAEIGFIFEEILKLFGNYSAYLKPLPVLLNKIW